MKPVSGLKLLLLLTILLLPQAGYSQQPKPKTAAPASAPKTEPKPTPKPASENSLGCPDPKAKVACDSYWELKRAHDKGLESSLSNPTNTTYVCFRPDVDQFFLVSFDKPFFRTHWDVDLKKKRNRR
jgi:hypothetical protein